MMTQKVPVNVFYYKWIIVKQTPSFSWKTLDNLNLGVLKMTKC